MKGMGRGVGPRCVVVVVHSSAMDSSSALRCIPPDDRWLRQGSAGHALDSPDVTEDQRTQLPPQYAPGEVEARRYDEWVAGGLFTADAGAPAPAYCIVIPPPNVTGSLHMGHALDHTFIDALIRRRRMQGYTTPRLPRMVH